MKMEKFILLSALMVTLTQGRLMIGSECVSPVKCLDKKIFTFCYIVDGTIVLQTDTFTCPNNYQCTGDPHTPCVEVGAMSTTRPPVTAPTSCQFNGNYPASECNQYYQCARVLWWFDIKLKTCPFDQAFDIKKSRCVPVSETGCVIY